jgi:hypothetical protein
MFALVAAGVAILADEPAKAEGDGATADRPAGAAGAKKESVEEKPIDRPRVEAAIATGLKWLARHQAADGHWSLDEFHKDGKCNCSDPANHKDDIGGTSLALLALLRAGHSHKAVNERSVYAKTVERGLRYLVTRQGADGGFEGAPSAEALAALTLCHCYGRTADPILKGPAQRAINRLVAVAYYNRLADAVLEKREGPSQSRSSSAIWSILALKEAQSAGLNIPNATEEQITKRHVFSREAAVKDLLDYFYASQALECVGKEYRFIGTVRTVNRLLDTQDQGRESDRADQKGSWRDADAKGAGGGRLTATALALLTLAGGHSTKLIDSHLLVAGKELPAAELDAAWEDLASIDFLRSQLGVLTLLATPKQAIPFLNERLRPAVAPAPGEQERVARWLADLDAKEFAVREKATRELAKGSDVVERAVHRALVGKPSLEVRQRLEQIQEKRADARQRRWRELMAVEVLVRLGTTEAQQVLARLAKGHGDAPLTQQVKAALESLTEAARQPAGADKPEPPADAAKPDKAPEEPEARRVPDDARVWVAFSKQQRFGVVCPRLRDPRNPTKPKLLTYDERGLTNSTCLRLDGKLALFGGDSGSFLKENGKLLKEMPIPGRDKDRSWQSVWETEGTKVRVTQSVEIVADEQMRLYDTVLVKYRLENRDDKPHTAGLRFLLNTCIGANTGTPFHVPETPMTAARLVNTMEVIPQAGMPAYVQALETGDLRDPNTTVAIVGLAVKGFELPEKVVICRWPDSAESGWGGSEAKADWKYESIDKNPHYKDACLVLYWAELKMQPGDKREMAFTYGLGRVSQDAGK